MSYEGVYDHDCGAFPWSALADMLTDDDLELFPYQEVILVIEEDGGRFWYGAKTIFYDILDYFESVN